MDGDREPAVVEFGGERTSRVAALVRLVARRWLPGVTWALAALGGLALFGSLVSEWQIVPNEFVDLSGEQELMLGVGRILTWGAGWVTGATLLAGCAGVALGGRSSARAQARLAGVGLAVALLVFLTAASVALQQETLYSSSLRGNEINLGRGLHFAYATVLLVGGAIWLSRPTQGAPTSARVRSAAPSQPGAPDELRVEPAKPFTHLRPGNEWR